MMNQQDNGAAIEEARIVEQVVALRQDVAALRQDMKTNFVEINTIFDRIDDHLRESIQIIEKTALQWKSPKNGA